MADIAYDLVRYNQVRARGSHNSYLRDEGIVDQMAYWRLRHVELDLHNTFINRTSRGDWFVYHENVESQRYSTVVKFSDGLKLLAGFHAAFPFHEVVTVALDLKSNLDSDHTPRILDDLIEKYLPGLVYKPKDFLGATNTYLQQSAHAWPLLKDLRGKFIFICTTGDLDDPGSHLRQYIAGGATQRTCFVAPQISDVAKLTDSRYQNAVFFNMEVSVSRALGPAVLAAGYISRGFGGNSLEEFQNGVQGKNHLIGTDQVNSLRYPWSTTVRNPKGWPFEGIDISVDANVAEVGTVQDVTVSSGDLYGRRDSCAFVEYSTSPTTDVTYEYAAFVPGSFTPNQFGKAGLMARASLDPDAANFAIVRLAEKNQPRAQVRSRSGASTDEDKLKTIPSGGGGINANSWVYLRLTLSNRGRTAEGFASYDGVEYVRVRKETFAAPLTLVGLVASSHNDDEVIRYAFTPIRAFTGTGYLRRIGQGVGAGASHAVDPEAQVRVPRPNPEDPGILE
jgi:hypothetical protein